MGPLQRLPALAVLGAAALAVALGGCAGDRESGANLVKGKQLFVERCGACHVLARAGTKGTTGPNLDAAFARSRRDGFRDSAISGVTYKQILDPNRTGVMPANLVTGDDARDVSTYVGRVAGAGGKDSGALAGVGQSQQKPLATAEGGTLAIPADPTGQLLFVYKNAEAPAGSLTIDSQNKSSTPHDIAIEGPGAKQAGKVVKGGGTSTVEVKLEPGKYTFLCTVPGHAAAGMKGTLTVT
jgi:mono/diheme cytochrome c family protein